MRLAVIGTGYVGLVAGAGFADFGNDVTCVDLDASRIEALCRGEVPFHEPGLPELLRRNVTGGRLSFTTDTAAAVREADVVLLAVGTPPGEDGAADLSQVLAAAGAAARALPEGAALVLKSTVPVGTAERVQKVAAAAAGRDVPVVSNPEFLKEGSAVEDFLRPARVIIGIGQPGQALTPAETSAAIRMRHLYEPVLRTSDRLLVMDSRSAELTKYACNAYLATRISFINDMANLCERTGADIEAVRRGMGTDPRIGDKFLFPGIGYGGSCFPKDVRALLHTGQQHGIELSIVAAAQAINEKRTTVLLFYMLSHLRAPGNIDWTPGKPRLHGRTVAVWGLSFKPETDDIREAPALLLIGRLLQAGAAVRVTDPAALETARRHFIDAVCDPSGETAQLARGAPGTDRRRLLLTFHVDPYEAARGADALLLCTEWRQYRQPNWKKLRELMKGDGVFDGRNAWDPAEVREAGFTYYGIGRPA